MSCGGSGSKSCWSCNGWGKQTCGKCNGCKYVKWYLQLKCEFKNNIADYITNDKSEFVFKNEKLMRTCIARTIYEETKQRVTKIIYKSF